MRKKYTLLILLLAGTSMAAMAQNGGRSINVVYLDGSDHVMSHKETQKERHQWNLAQRHHVRHLQQSET